MPARDSIVEVREFTPPTDSQPIAGKEMLAGKRALEAKPAAAKYLILVTNEVDEYEKAKTPQAKMSLAAASFAAAAPAPAGDNYKGTARKAAKLSIGTGKTGQLADLKDLIASLPAEATMSNHKPPITTTPTSGRVKEEQRDIRVKAFLYAASREADNDFHLIIGRDPKKPPEMYMTMEISGLPPKNSASFKQLQAARDAYKKFFANNLPGTGYSFYTPPIPVEIEGSLFFDMSHAGSSSSRPGPKSLKSRMPTIWEVHPVTKITFEP